MDGSPKGSEIRNWLAAGVLGIALAGGGYLVGLDSRPVPAPSPAPETIAKDPEPAPVPEAVLGRAGLLRIAAAAADRFAGGAAVTTPLAGRRFRVGIPFGCGSPSEGREPTGWSYDEQSQALRIRVTPVDWTDAEWLASAVPEGAVDAVDGFWLPRPWTSSERCPAEDAGTPRQSGSSVGLARFFGTESDRSERRRGRPFEIVTKVEPDSVPRDGLQLVLEGRVAQLPGGTASVHCHAASQADRPTCRIAVEFERIAVMDPNSGTELANWRL
ncbi:MAG TPA: hypothetical protein VFO42_09465 [Sphingomicrobium sp.]|nr:hypothetical protein [Sphingomicrobium sp.]